MAGFSNLLASAANVLQTITDAASELRGAPLPPAVARALLDGDRIGRALGDGSVWEPIGGTGTTFTFAEVPDGTELTVEVRTQVEYDRLEGAVPVAAGASGMKAINGTGGSREVWAPAGRDGTVVVRRSSPRVSDHQLLTLTTEAALSYEHLGL